MTATATASPPKDSAEPGGFDALVFPGQGSQRPQMAVPWEGHPAFARWREADDVLDRDVSRLGTAAGAEELRDPVNCQIALFVHQAVLLEAWRASGGTADVVAGHSLGEYNALLAAGVLAFDDGLRLVERRATATAAAALTQPGGMVACLGGDATALRDACQAAGVVVANDNAEGQLVVAGDNTALERFGAAAADTRARIVRLEVGAAYHSPHMQPAVEAFGEAVAGTDFADATIPVISNVDAAAHRLAGDWPNLLRAQLTAPVRWRETVLTLAAMGVTDVVELGASPVLSGLVKRTAGHLRRRSIATPDGLATS